MPPEKAGFIGGTLLLSLLVMAHYRGTRLDGLEEEGLDEPGLAEEEHGQDEKGEEAETADRDYEVEQGEEAETAYRDYEVDNGPARRLHHATHVRVDITRIQHLLNGFSVRASLGLPVFVILIEQTALSRCQSLIRETRTSVRPYAIHQWLVFLIAVHPHYQSIVQPEPTDMY